MYQPKPGDAVFARTTTNYGRLIRAGQSIRWWKGRDWNHMAIVVKVDADGTVWCLQMVKHCELVRLQDISPTGEIEVVPAPASIDINRALVFANLQLGVDYGVLDIFSISINIFLPSVLGFDIHRNGTLICSALVARSWEHGGFILLGKVSPFTITPGQFYILLGSAGYALDQIIFHKG